MNVIVSNKYAAMLSNLNIDLIKSINGEFDADELVAQFDNFFFNKMILDITAIRNYRDISQIQRLSFGMDMTRVILLLDDSPEVNSPQYMSELVSMGIYNFTKNIDGIVYLIDNPNTYKDVAQYHMLGASNMMASQEMEVPNNSRKDNRRGNNREERNFINASIAMPIVGGTRVIGFKDLTDHAGATTLIYMLKKQLEENYSVLGIELDKNDFMFFNDQNLRSMSSKELGAFIKGNTMGTQIVLVDVNDSSEEANCSEMIYLIEPSTLMLNKMIRRDRNILDKIKGKKVVLNKSLLDSNDVKDFEYEARCSVFQNIPPLDDKKERHRVLDEFLNKLGFDKNKPANDGNRGARLFGIVKE